MSKTILFGKKAKRELMIGVNAVANPVCSTIGPKGRNVVFDKGYGGPVITNDGVSIAREIVLSNPIQNIGCMITKEVAQKTNDEAGDGTSTSIALFQSIAENGIKLLTPTFWNKIWRIISFKYVRINAILVKRGLDKASEIAINYLKNNATQIKSNEEIKQVATISSESQEIGQLITDAISKLGIDSTITVDESPIIGMNFDVSQGLEFEKGFISPYFITDPNRMESEIKDAKILVTDLKIGTVDEILPLLEEVMKSGKRELVIIADDILGEALNTFIVNKMRGALTVLGIKSPGFGLRKKDYLEDIATVTGAHFISSDIQSSLAGVNMTDLGSADKVISTKDKTTIIGGKGIKEAIDARISMAKNELERLESQHDKLKVEERIARMSGGVAIIKVGASTETETKYLKLKVEDAVNAVKAALEEGIVSGGGSSLIQASKAVLEAKKGIYTADELLGFDILIEALKTPLKYIAENAGKNNGMKVVEKILKTQRLKVGYDALNDEYLDDMISHGIIDPVKVERCAIKNAVSAAGTLITLETVMAEEKKILPDNI